MLHSTQCNICCTTKTVETRAAVIDRVSCPCIPDPDAGASYPPILPMCVRPKQVCLSTVQSEKVVSGIPACWSVLGHLRPLSDTRQSGQWQRTSNACVASTFTRDTAVFGFSRVILQHFHFPFLSPRRCLALNLLQLRLVSPICCSNAFPPIPPFLFQLQWCHCPVHFSEALVKADLREASVEGDLSEASLKAHLSALQWSFSWKMTSVRTKSLKWDFLRCRPQPNSTLCTVHTCLQH